MDPVTLFLSIFESSQLLSKGPRMIIIKFSVSVAQIRYIYTMVQVCNYSTVRVMLSLHQFSVLATSVWILSVDGSNSTQSINKEVVVVQDPKKVQSICPSSLFAAELHDNCHHYCTSVTLCGE